MANAKMFTETVLYKHPVNPHYFTALLLLVNLFGECNYIYRDLQGRFAKIKLKLCQLQVCSNKHHAALGFKGQLEVTSDGHTTV